VRHPDGYVELRDRAKDIIISGDENVSTEVPAPGEGVGRSPAPRPGRNRIGKVAMTQENGHRFGAKIRSRCA
jgi:hypothetical protein